MIEALAVPVIVIATTSISSDLSPQNRQLQLILLVQIHDKFLQLLLLVYQKFHSLRLLYHLYFTCKYLPVIPWTPLRCNLGRINHMNRIRRI